MDTPPFVVDTQDVEEALTEEELRLAQAEGDLAEAARILAELEGEVP